jgi:cytochrome b subunit of formate dehydrogenase
MQVGWPNFVAQIYMVLIVGTIGGMVAYCAIDFRRFYKNMLAAPQVRRMDTNAVMQHTVLLVSFTILVITGFALRFHDGWLVSQLFAWDGGFEVRGVIHRAAAALFLFGCVWHLLYLRTPHGRDFFVGMLPERSDFTLLRDMMRYNLGKSPVRPRFGRFSYLEKVEYWALIWGAVIMSVTGLLLWFDNFAVRFVPKGFLNVMLVIHFYEAVLATLAIVVWHLYSTVFSPGVYPGNPAWLNGKMPKSMYEHERVPDVPAGKGRASRPGEIEEGEIH